YRQRYRIMNWWYALKRMMHSQQDDDYPYTFDAFVAHDYDDFDWISQHLIPQLEVKHGLRLCIGERDFLPGGILEEVIVENIQNSRKTLLLLTPKFIQSNWCDFELAMSRNKLFATGKDVVVAVILKPLPMGSINGKVYNVLKTRLYLEWKPHDVYAQKLFWRKLVNTLRNGKA
ncbi:hypothetical protein CAPTEDRAFT_77876, partial [Capitella teleta]